MNTSLAVVELRSLCLAAFAAVGVPASVAETVVEALLDACNGFAFPAINAGLDAAFARVAEQGASVRCPGARTTRAAFWGILWKK